MAERENEKKLVICENDIDDDLFQIAKDNIALFIAETLGVEYKDKIIGLRTNEKARKILNRSQR